MAQPDFQTLLDGKTEDQIFDEITTDLKDPAKVPVPLPVDDWTEGAATRTLLKAGLSPALSRLWSAVASVARGGFLRLAQAQAEEDPAGWEAQASRFWLYLLASYFYGVQIKPAAFAVGTFRVINSGAVLQTLTNTHVISDNLGHRYTVQGTTPIPPGTGVGGVPPIYVSAMAESPGIGYNIPPGTATTLNVSLPGIAVSNQPQSPSTTWLTTPGASQESPKELADRCALRFGRLSKLQSVVTDGYKSMALDLSAVVRKVAVWPNYSDAAGTYTANTVTLYLGSESGPVPAAVAAAVLAAMAPYVSIHDVLECRPCGMATYQPAGHVYCTDGKLVAPVTAAISAAFAAKQKDLQIGDGVLAWEVRTLVKVPGVRNFVDTLADYQPAKNALVTLSPASLVITA